jgi:redox-sensing transcriptional repressor
LQPSASNRGFSAVIVGAGNLGKALVSSHMFERRGVERLALFDISEAVVGTSVAGIPVFHINNLESYCKENEVTIGVLTTPKEEAHKMALSLANAGVKGIWNFSNMELKLEDSDVVIQNIHLGDSLMTLCYQLCSKNLNTEK